MFKTYNILGQWGGGERGLDCKERIIIIIIMPNISATLEGMLMHLELSHLLMPRDHIVYILWFFGEVGDGSELLRFMHCININIGSENIDQFETFKLRNQ